MKGRQPKMSEKQSPDKLLIHVELEYEATTITATLKEKGLPSYWRPTASKGLLGLPGAMGIPENGYDVFVTEENFEKATQVVNGLGYGMTEDETEQAVEVAEGEEPDVDPPKYTEEQLREDIAQLSTGKKIGFYAICFGFFFVAMTVFVWGIDAVIAWIISLFK